MDGSPNAGGNDLNIEAIRQRIHLHLRGLGASRDDADDLAQDVLIAVWRRRGGIEPEALASYAVKSATNAYVQHRSRASTRLEINAADGDGSADDLASDPLALEAFSVIFRDDELRRWAPRLLVALGSLCESQREAVVNRHVLGLSVRAAAEKIGVSAATIKDRCKRGLKHLRNDHPALADLLDERSPERPT